MLPFGSLVACNRFENQGLRRAETHLLSVTECEACNLVQLSEFPPLNFVRPRVPWIHYNEPVAHLDAVASQLQSLLSMETACVVGVGPFDDPLLDRLPDCRFSQIKLDIASRLPIEQGSYPYLESIQELLRPNILADLAAEQGTAHLVSCRYLLEHSHDPIATLQGLRHLIKADGFLLIEIPDSTKFLSTMDYSFIWEEHICYFTEETFRACALRAGYEVTHFFRYCGTLEDALVFILRPQPHTRDKVTLSQKCKSSDIFLNYRAEFDHVREKHINALEKITATGRKVVIFGAGHQSVMFINALGLQDHIAYVIDDDPDKAGYLIPGTAIEIVSSEQLTNDHSIDVCLLGVNPGVEERIRAECSAYLNCGGRMCSIFPGAGTDTLMDELFRGCCEPD